MEANYELMTGDLFEHLESIPDDSIDLVFMSPPYSAEARTYGINFNLKGQDWVDWMVGVFRECSRVCKGLIAAVVEGSQRSYRYNATPYLLAADLHRAGFNLRKPPIFHRNGVSGSGGRDWLRNDYESIICATRPGRLPWSDNTAMGGPPKYPRGGKPSSRNRKGERASGRHYTPPERTNPGNVIRCNVGGGNMGDKLCHENEAPFPETLAEFFIRSFCPRGGVVLDPFCGSGTTVCVAIRHHRRAIGIDIRESQIALTTQRIKNVQRYMELHEKDQCDGE